jgi:hypothetical protein
MKKPRPFILPQSEPDYQFGVEVEGTKVSVLYDKPYPNIPLTTGEPIHTPIGELAFTYSHKKKVGLTFECEYIESAIYANHDGCLMRMSTSYTGELLADAVLIYAKGHHLFIGTPSAVPMDNDSSRI